MNTDNNLQVDFTKKLLTKHYSLLGFSSVNTCTAWRPEKETLFWEGQLETGVLFCPFVQTFCWYVHCVVIECKTILENRNDRIYCCCLWQPSLVLLCHCIVTRWGGWSLRNLADLCWGWRCCRPQCAHVHRHDVCRCGRADSHRPKWGVLFVFLYSIFLNECIEGRMWI